MSVAPSEKCKLGVAPCVHYVGVFASAHGINFILKSYLVKFFCIEVLKRIDSH